MGERLVDVYLVTYNRAAYLKESIRSILGQSYKEFNLIILDNCSDDDTREIVESFFDSRLSYIRHEKNIGGLENINFAIKHAESKYFLVFHDDDIMHETLIQEEIEIMEKNPEISMLSCRCDIIDENKNRIHGGKCTGNLDQYKDGEFFEAYIKEHRFILFPSIIYRREFIRKNLICLNCSVGPSADVYMCFEIEKRGGVIAIFDRTLMSYRKHGAQDSSQHRVDMIVKLFKALGQDLYYSQLLKKNKEGQKSYYRWLMHNEICMIQSKLTSCEDAENAQKEYESVIYHSILDHVKYKVIILDEKYFIISRIAYWLIKKLRRQD